MNGVKLTKIAKKSEQLSHFMDSSSLTDRIGFLKSSKILLFISYESCHICVKCNSNYLSQICWAKIFKTTNSQQNEFSVLEIELGHLLLVSDILQSLSIARNQLIDALQYDKGSMKRNAGIEMALDNFNYAYERSKGGEEKLSAIICKFKHIICF